MALLTDRSAPNFRSGTKQLDSWGQSVFIELERALAREFSKSTRPAEDREFFSTVSLPHHDCKAGHAGAIRQVDCHLLSGDVCVRRDATSRRRLPLLRLFGGRRTRPCQNAATRGRLPGRSQSCAARDVRSVRLEASEYVVFAVTCYELRWDPEVE